MPTRLLVSVRTREEARTAVEAGVDILDVKEPRRGSLGRADDAVLKEIIAEAAGRVPVSAALGEWHQCRNVSLPAGLAWVKAGLSRLTTPAERDRARLVWTRLQRLASPARLIGVVYADRHLVHGIRFLDMIRWVNSVRQASRQPPGILVDTCVKNGGGLLAHLSLNQLRDWRRQCDREGLFLALAGSLHLADIGLLLREASPDVIAVRGAACGGGRRELAIQSDRVRSLARCLREGS